MEFISMSLVSTLFIYDKICENVKKMENFEISIYLGEKIFSRVKHFLRWVGVCAPYGFDFWRGVKTPPAHPWWVHRPFRGDEAQFLVFRGGLRTPVHPRAHVWKSDISAKNATRLLCSGDIVRKEAKNILFENISFLF